MANSMNLRVDGEGYGIVEHWAEIEERSLAQMARILIREADQHRRSRYEPARSLSPSTQELLEELLRDGMVAKVADKDTE